MKKNTVLLMIFAAGLLGAAMGGFAVALFQPSFLAGSANEAAVRAVLRANPEIILEALQVMQSRRAALSRQQQRETIVANRALLLEDVNSAVGGNPQGDVTVVEFFDYRCPYCRTTMATLQQLIKSDPKLRVVYKEFPVLGAESLTASRLAVAARRDPRYEALHAALMTAPSPLDENAVLQIASDLGFDRAAMASAMKAPEIEDILQANHAVARALGLQGTPAFIIGDVLVPGVATLEEFKQLIAQARAKGGDAAIGKTDG